MASVQWIGKEAVVGHHREVPYHLLRGDPRLSVGEDGGAGEAYRGVGSGNLLMQGDKRPGGGNVLKGDVLAELPENPSSGPDGRGPRVVFGEACRLGAARLKREGVAFRQIPYQIKVS